METVPEMVTQDVASGLAKWVRWIGDRHAAPRVMVGKAHSRGILDGQGFRDASITLRELMGDMPEGSRDYADVCSSGAWEHAP